MLGQNPAPSTSFDFPYYSDVAFLGYKIGASFIRSEGANSFPSSCIMYINTLVIIMRLNQSKIE